MTTTTEASEVLVQCDALPRQLLGDGVAIEILRLSEEKRTAQMGPHHRIRRSMNWLVVLAVALLFSTAAGTARAGEVASANERVVRDFVAAWSQLDSAVLVDYFTEDGTYHNMMLEPVSGRKALLEFIDGFLSNWSETQWELVHLVAQGELVVAERVDHTRIGERSVSLPCVGVFEMREGKIHVWRDYFDLATYTKAFETPAEDSSAAE